MAGQTNLQKDVLVLNMEQQLSEIAQSMFDKKIAELTDQELYYVVLVLTKRLMKVSDENEGEKKTGQKRFQEGERRAVAPRLIHRPRR